MDQNTASPALPARRIACARCGASFDCGSGGRDGGCWCVDEPYRVPMPAVADAAEDCLCPDCLRAKAASVRHGLVTNRR